tara:strand:+ start:800 stop:2443 length:1644 start_codon:yes stop_codon:yes gene_type:complete
MRIINHTFNGVAPGVSAKHLADTLGVEANNLLLESGRLEPLHQLLQTATVSAGTDTIYLMGSYWLQFQDPSVQVVPSPVANNYDDTFYFTGDDYPCISWSSVAFTEAPYPATSYRLGVPAPANAPTIDTINETADDAEEKIDIGYVYTFVTGDGREGPPSPVSTITYDVTDNQTQDITVPDTSLSGSNHNVSGAVKRIYRTNIGSGDARFQYVGEVALAVTEFSDTLRVSQLGETLPTTDWSGPPDDDSVTFPDGQLQGLCDMGHGILAGFTGHTLWFCEPYLPHAWPVKYTIPLGDDIVAIAPVSDGLVVGTTGRPVFISGSDPLSLVDTRYDAKQACVSASSMVAMEGYAVYASPDGLIAIDSAEAINLTDKTHRRSDWQALVPSSIAGFDYEGRYVGFYDDTVDQKGFIVDPRGDLNAFTELDFYYTVGVNDLLTDSLYVLDGTNIKEFDGNTTKYSFTWKSKEFEMPSPTNMSALLIDADGSVTFTLYGDGTQIGSPVTVTDREVYRLPSATTLYQTIQYKLQSSDAINSVKIGTSVQELVEE